MCRVLLLLALSLHPRTLAAQAPGYWLEARLEPTVLWVQAQAMYRLRFYQSIDVRDLEILPPKVEHAELRRLGPDHVLEETRDGQRYRVIERSYAITPYASGRMRVSVQATGLVVAAETSEGSQAVHIAVPDIEADVRPLPAEAVGKPWLAARTVTLEDGWASDLQGVQQGDVLRRIVRIRATGTEASAIPLPSMEAPGFSVHADTPRLENLIENGWNIGVREQPYRLVPLKTGALPAPQASLAWWDSLRGKMQFSQTAPRMLHVTGMGTLPPVASKAGTYRLKIPAPDSQPTGRAAITIGLLAGLGALFALGLYWKRKTTDWRKLRKACRNHDPKAAAAALLAWWPSPVSRPRALGALALDLADQRMSKAIRALERHLYGPPPANPWDGTLLLEACRALHGRLPRPFLRLQRSRPVLPPLYPD